MYHFVIRLKAYAAARGGCEANPVFGAFGLMSSVVIIVSGLTIGIGNDRQNFSEYSRRTTLADVC